MSVPNSFIPPIRLDPTISSPLTTKGDIYVFSSINDRLPVGIDGQILISDSTTIYGLKWAAPSAATAHNILSVTHTDTLAASVVRGDLIVGNATPKWSRLAVGASGKFVRSDGTDTTWQNVAASDIAAGAALTKVDDTNVTLTLGGTPATALLSATSITAGWTGTLADSRLSTTAVAAGSYGSATQSPTYTVSATGRLTAAANVTITPAAGSITGAQNLNTGKNLRVSAGSGIGATLVALTVDATPVVQATSQVYAFKYFT